MRRHYHKKHQLAPKVILHQTKAATSRSTVTFLTKNLITWSKKKVDFSNIRSCLPANTTVRQFNIFGNILNFVNYFAQAKHVRNTKSSVLHVCNSFDQHPRFIQNAKTRVWKGVLIPHSRSFFTRIPHPSLFSLLSRIPFFFPKIH